MNFSDSGEPQLPCVVPGSIGRRSPRGPPVQRTFQGSTPPPPILCQKYPSLDLLWPVSTRRLTRNCVTTPTTGPMIQGRTPLSWKWWLNLLICLWCDYQTDRANEECAPLWLLLNNHLHICRFICMQDSLQGAWAPVPLTADPGTMGTRAPGPRPCRRTALTHCTLISLRFLSKIVQKLKDDDPHPTYWGGSWTCTGPAPEWPGSPIP